MSDPRLVLPQSSIVSKGTGDALRPYVGLVSLFQSDAAVRSGLCEVLTVITPEYLRHVDATKDADIDLARLLLWNHQNSAHDTATQLIDRRKHAYVAKHTGLGVRILEYLGNDTNLLSEVFDEVLTPPVRDFFETEVLPTARAYGPMTTTAFRTRNGRKSTTEHL